METAIPTTKGEQPLFNIAFAVFFCVLFPWQAVCSEPAGLLNLPAQLRIRALLCLKAFCTSGARMYTI